MAGMRLDIEHKPVESRDEASPTGYVEIEQGEGRAVLLTPNEIDPSRSYPLITVLHGAGRHDELLVKGCEREAERRQALFLVPRSIEPTWDLIINGEGGADLAFLEYAYDLIYRRYPIDQSAQALLGYSDGSSYALSLGLSNPQIFDAVMGWAAGFVVLDRRGGGDGDKPRIYLEHGTHDQLFPFDQIAIPMRDNLRRAGYDLTFSVDEGGRHMPSGSFLGEALDWYLSSRSS